MLTLHIVRDRISLTKYSCCRYCLTQFKREAGENPARSRRCDGEMFHDNPLDEFREGMECR